MGTNVRYRIAVANLTAAKLMVGDESRKLDRDDSLGRVLDRLNQVQRETSDEFGLWWDATIDELACLRLMGRSDDALRNAKALIRKRLPTGKAMALEVEELLLAIETCVTPVAGEPT